MALYFCVALDRSASDPEALAEACLRFTPDLVYQRGGGAFFLEVSRCLSLYSPESLRARLAALCRGFGFRSFRITQASTLPRAWLLARHALAATTWEQAPIDAIADVVDPLKLHREWEKKITEMAETLFLLGVRRLGALKKLPPDSAVSRFGEIYRELLANLGPEERFVWERFRPREKFCERFEFNPDDRAHDLEPVLFHTKGLLDRALKRAYGRGKALSEIELRIECETRKDVREYAVQVRIRFTFPQTSAPIAMRSLHERLSVEMGRRGLDAPISAIEFEVLELEERRSAQVNFLGGEAQEEENAREAFRDLVTALALKLSPGKEVFQAECIENWRPERSWRRVLVDPARLKSASLPIPERPLTLFSPPEPLRRLGRYLFWGERRYVIRKFLRAERLSSEWWEADGGFDRIYYRVRVAEKSETEGPGRERDFWVFRELPSEGRTRGGVFLQGVF